MNVVILCGGFGNEEGVLPKPLNMINGKPSIKYCLEHIPESVKTLHFIVSPELVEYNFAEVVTSEFKSIRCFFYYLPYFTRGPIESAYLGTLDLEEGPIVFLDNDIIYNFPGGVFDRFKDPFLGYSTDNNSNRNDFSFIKLGPDNVVLDIKEKQKISDTFICGVYGFPSLLEFRKLAISIITKPFTNDNLYMSAVFKMMINRGILIRGIVFEKVRSIGSIDEIKNLWPGLPKPKMRVCFDLDNTLVTYPVIPNDYATVKPIKKMIDLAKKLHSDGHTIIIHTARRMLTHKNNIGAVIKDIGPITFKTLEDFSIPYHELIFGKPYADIYIDDKSLNPYFNNISNFGYFPDIFDKKPLNSLNANKFNTLKLTDRGFIEKTGPENTLRGEIYYYKHIPDSLKSYFPKYIDSSDDRLVIEHIKGVPVFSLYKANLISEHHIDRLCEFLDILHSFKGFAETTITSDNLCNNYKQKLIRRFAIKEDYPFEDSELIQGCCLDSIDRYLTNRISIVDYIHGDFWFSNIIFDFQGKIKCIDMKGQVDGILTTGGDPMYDYGKLYQSILGYDCVLNGVKFPENNGSLKIYFETKIAQNGVLLEPLKAVTFALVLGTLPFIESYEAKQRVWNWIKGEFVLGAVS